MALKLDIRGMVWRYPDYFEVGREELRRYAAACLNDHPAYFTEKAASEYGYDSIVAPLTFVSILAKLVQVDFFRHVDMGMEKMILVQVDQQFLYRKTIVAGTKLWARMQIQSVDERFGADIVVTKNILIDQLGDVVLEAFTTLMGQEADPSASHLRWDSESGQVVRTAD